MEKKYNIEYWSKLFFLMLLFLGGGFVINYAVDTFWTYRFGFGYIGEQILNLSGRVTLAAVYKLYDLTGLSMEFFYYISLCMAAIAMMIAVTVYDKVLSPFIANKDLRLVLSFLSIVNLYFIEYLMFIEKGIFSLGVLLAVFAVYFIDKGISEKRLKHYIIAELFIFGVILTYQGIIALFFILSLPIVYKRCFGFIDYVKKIILLIILYWIPVGIYMVMFKLLFNSDRTGSGASMIENITFAILSIKKTYKNTYNLLPSYWYLALICIILFISIISIIYTKKGALIGFLNLFILLLAVSILPVAAIIVARIERPRVIYPMASGVAVLAINYFVNHNSIELKKVCNTIVAGVCLCLLLLQYFAYTRIYIDKYKMNYADYIRIQEIGQTIREYEMETGNTIKQIAFYRDMEHDDPYYKGIYHEPDLVVSSFHSWDSQLYAINYYLGTDYTRCPEDKSYEEHFSKLEWDCYSPSQMICDYDTLHYCVY